jgi:hypothetical protein
VRENPNEYKNPAAADAHKTRAPAVTREWTLPESRSREKGCSSASSRCRRKNETFSLLVHLVKRKKKIKKKKP